LLARSKTLSGRTLAEVRRLEELLEQDEVRAALRRFAHELLGLRDIRVAIP
jgi:hypothetical protein